MSSFSAPVPGSSPRIFPAQRFSQNRRAGFTLIELLVVISIIALLIGILLPALGRAKESAKVALNLGNLRQMGIGVNLYLANSKGYFPPHEGNALATGEIVDRDPYKLNGSATTGMVQFSDYAGLSADYPTGNNMALPLISSTSFAKGAVQRRAHWVDYIYPYASEPKIYVSPMVEKQELEELNLDLAAVGAYGRRKWGGYGYNQHYMGWEATLDAAGNVITPAWQAKIDSQITAPADTVMAGDSHGSANTATKRGNSYCLEGPFYSMDRGKKFGAYYKGPVAGPIVSPPAPETVETILTTEKPGTTNWSYREYPAPRNNGAPGFIFADGHAGVKKLSEIDDYNGDGVFDNGYWNGTADSDPLKR